MGCTKEDNVTPSKETNPSNQPVTEVPVTKGPATKEPIVETPETTPDNMVVSKLTGEFVAKDIGTKRPFAIMLNNIKVANPQGSTEQASILYEILAEGGITRLMGIYEDFDSERIGSVRSARHYFVSVADEYDAVFCHFGQTHYAVSKIEELGVDTLSGLSSEGSTVFYRDSHIKAPHNAFASFKGIQNGMKKKHYRTEYKEDLSPHYEFYEEDTDLLSDVTANKVTVSFSRYAQPYFIYDKNEKIYKRYQFKKPHIDANTNNQLTYKNILIQYVKEYNIDNNGYQTMDIENNEGKGLYITNGKAISITWKKNEKNKYMQYFDGDGNLLHVNKGKTYIALFPNNRIGEIVLQ